MLDPLIKKSLSILASAIIVVFLYFGAYLPYMKSQKLINALSVIQTQGGISWQGYKKAFESVLDYYSPVGQQESARQLGDISVSIISRQKNLPKNIAEELLKFNLKYFEPLLLEKGGNVSQSFMEVARLYYVIGVNYDDQNYLDKAIEHYQKGLELSPKRPQFLYGLFEAYFQKRDYNSAIQIGEEILKYWPDDTNTKQAVEELKKLKLNNKPPKF